MNKNDTMKWEDILKSGNGKCVNFLFYQLKSTV